MLPIAAGFRSKPAPVPAIEIISEPNCLSQESADGFRGLTAPASLKAVLLCGVSAINASLAHRLRERALAGAWIIWESAPLACDTREFAWQAGILREVFGAQISDPIVLSPDQLRNAGMFVRYRWPCAALVRSFSAVIPVACRHTETIAWYGNTPVAMRRSFGRGGLVFLGSMLGPNLRAEEREAHAIGTKIVRALA